MMEVDPRKAQQEMDYIRECHAKFSFLVDLYEHHWLQLWMLMMHKLHIKERVH